jgi:hypothetical protein
VKSPLPLVDDTTKAHGKLKNKYENVPCWKFTAQVKSAVVSIQFQSKKSNIFAVCIWFIATKSNTNNILPRLADYSS